MSQVFVVNPIDHDNLNAASLKLKEKIPKEFLNPQTDTTALVSDIMETPADLKERPFSCKKCDETFSKEQFLTAHDFMRHRENTTEVIEQHENFPLHEFENNDKRQYPCPDCNKSFKYLSKLKEHKTIHSEERQFGCSECDKRYKSKDKLKVHKTKFIHQFFVDIFIHYGHRKTGFMIF